MRIIKTKENNKLGVIAATKLELDRLKMRQHIRLFNDAISLQPAFNDAYKCWLMVYTFEDVARAKLFRLAYAQVMKRTKHIRRAPAVKIAVCKWTRDRAKKRTAIRKKRNARKRERRRYYKLLPLVRAGNIATLEAKARAITRELLIIDLL